MLINSHMNFLLKRLKILSYIDITWLLLTVELLSTTVVCFVCFKNPESVETCFLSSASCASIFSCRASNALYSGSGL